VVRHRRTANAIAQLRKADSNRLGGLRQEARAGHPWNGIDFKSSGKDFFGPVRLVLARVIKDVVKLWANFADR
jgi:hypothetical protein